MFPKERGADLDIYLITGRSGTLGRDLLSVVDEALAGGIRFVQLREKDLGGRMLLDLALRMRELTSRYGAMLIINDRVDVAMLSNADGVHLGASGISPLDARELLGEGKIIGASAHSVEEAVAAERMEADFITFGPVFHTPSKAPYGEPVGTEALEDAVSWLEIPVYAIGGINAGNIGEAVASGARGAALISAVMAAPDVRGSVEGLISGIRKARAVRSGLP